MTHKVGNDPESWLTMEDAKHLLANRWLGTGTEGLGPDPTMYPPGNGRRQIERFNEMAVQGAAVVAAFPGIPGWPEHYRVVGRVEPQSIFRHGRLICLALSQARVFDSSASFLGNLPPVQCTLQRCHERAMGRLAKLASREPLDRTASGLHTYDAEWLTLNHLISSKACATVWSGNRAYPGIDHAGWTSAGGEVLSQTSVSIDKSVIEKKVRTLRAFESSARRLVLYAPRVAAPWVALPVEFVSLEQAFADLEASVSGRRLVDRWMSVVEVDSPPM